MLTLGFGPSPKAKRIYLNRQYPDCLWYFWNFDSNKHEPIVHESITGTLTRVEVEPGEHRGKPNDKILLYLSCDRQRFILVVGLETFTAKGLINALVAADLKTPITIAPEAGDSENVLFARVYRGDGEAVYVPVEQQRETIDLLSGLMAQFGSVPSKPLNPTKPQLPAIQKKALPTIDTTNLTISDQQRQELGAIAKANGWSVEAIRAYLESCGYTNSRLVLNKDFPSICQGFAQQDIIDHFHDLTAVPASNVLPLGDWEASA